MRFSCGRGRRKRRKGRLLERRRRSERGFRRFKRDEVMATGKKIIGVAFYTE